MCYLTTTEVAALLGRSRRHINREAAALFGQGGWQRFLSQDQVERLRRRLEQPGRWKTLSPNQDTSLSGG